MEKRFEGQEIKVNQGAGNMTVSDYIALQKKTGAGATLPRQAARGEKAEGRAAGEMSAGDGNLTDRGYPSSAEGFNKVQVESGSPGNLARKGYPSTTDGYPDAYGTEKRYTDNIVEYLIPKDNKARSGNKRAKTTGIVIHYTDGAKKDGNKEIAQTPKQTIDYWIKEQVASAHLVVGENGDIYQAIPNDEVAYHAGENDINKFVPGIQDILEGHPNSRTIGIEMENNKLSGAFSPETYNATVQLTAELCMEYALDPQTSIYTHNDITGKMCPKYFVNNPGTFSLFKNDVEMEMGNLGSVGYK